MFLVLTFLCHCQSSGVVRVKSWCRRSQTIKPRNLVTGERPTMAIGEGMCSVPVCYTLGRQHACTACSGAALHPARTHLLESWSLDLLPSRSLDVTEPPNVLGPPTVVLVLRTLDNPVDAHNHSISSILYLHHSTQERFTRYTDITSHWRKG
jgi:hypothetical protein